jgi:hypothetical protein
LNLTTRDQQNDNAGSAAQPAPPRIADKDSPDGLHDLDAAMELGMNRVGVLEGMIEKARSECSEYEAKLITLAYDSLLRLGLITASVVARVP